MDETFHKVEEHLKSVLPRRERTVPITPETEIYRDLGMYGDVIAFDLVLWAQHEFGAFEGSLRLTNYAPGEDPFHKPRQFLRRLMGWKERQYKSLTVRDVVTAIESKRWPD